MTGHNEECICAPCMMADMASHLMSIGRDDVALAVENIPATVDSERTRYAKPGQRVGRGVVRLVSERQVRFIKSLLSSRDTSGLVRLPGSENIEHMSLAGARDLIDRLLACPMLPNAKPANLASDAQKSFVESLLSQREFDGTVNLDTMTKSEASKLISVLKTCPFKARKVVASETTIPDGRYAVENENGELRFYVLRTAKSSGRQWLSVMYSDNESLIRGNAEKSIRAKIAADPKEALRRFGQEIGSCGHCGRTLTDDDSRTKGIGPICEGKGF